MVSETPEKTSFDEKNVVVEAVAYEAKDDSEGRYLDHLSRR